MREAPDTESRHSYARESDGSTIQVGTDFIAYKIVGTTNVKLIPIDMDDARFIRDSLDEVIENAE